MDLFLIRPKVDFLATPSRQGLLTRLLFAALSASLLTSCKEVRDPFEAAESRHEVQLGTRKFAIPQSLFVSRPGDSGPYFLVTSWPDIEKGPPAAKSFDEYASSKISILVLSAEADIIPGGALDRMLLKHLEGDGLGREQRPAARKLPNFQGFERFVRGYNDREKAMPGSAFEEYDIFVRRKGSGPVEAFAICDGNPNEPNRHPHCKLKTVFEAYPDISFEIGFSRSHLLPQIEEIERDVLKKFREFEVSNPR